MLAFDHGINCSTEKIHCGPHLPKLNTEIIVTSKTCGILCLNLRIQRLVHGFTLVPMLAIVFLYILATVNKEIKSQNKNKTNPLAKIMLYLCGK